MGKKDNSINEAKYPQTGATLLKKSSKMWIWMGLILSVLGSIIFILCYELFQSRADSYLENPVETEENIKWLYQNNWVLYRDLYNTQNNIQLNYVDLYYPFSNKAFEIGLEFENQENFQASQEAEKIVTEVTEAKEESIEVYTEIFYSYPELAEKREHIAEYFDELESQFSQLNETYDYFIKDTKTGAFITNTANKDNLFEEDYIFYLTFQYDEKGNVTIGSIVKGEDKDWIRKIANEQSRSVIDNLKIEDEMKEYLVIKGLTDCEITYGITKVIWEQIQDPTIYSGRYNYTQQDVYSAYILAGCNRYYLIFLSIILLLAVFLPYIGEGRPWSYVKICLIMPLEGLALIVIFLISMGDKVVEMVAQMSTGKTMQHLENMGLYASDAESVLYFGHLCYYTLLFAGAWYVGICLRAVREQGIITLVKKRSWIYQIFPFVKCKCIEFYNLLCHLDLTKNAKKIIIKVVLVNAVVLFFISSLWFSGWIVIVIYSLILYFLLKKYVSNLQKKYSILLGAINEIAHGNLNVVIKEDLGIFEPFKPQIFRIQQGFRNAVEEEMKSQRMKTELITNVSHDLKTPLTAIITYIGLLKGKAITEQQRTEYLDTLERKALRLKVLIEDLFEVSRATSKSITLNIVDVDIINLVKQVEFEMSDKLKDAKLEVRMNLPETKVILPLDSQKTYRIYENLFGNIAKYAMAGTRVYIDAFLAEDAVAITLKNITADEIQVNPEELTERFVRGDSSRNTEGSGLGLAIAKNFAELQNGKLVLEVDGDLFKVITIWKFPVK